MQRTKRHDWHRTFIGGRLLFAGIALATGAPSTGQAGFLDEMRGAIDTVREATETVNDAKDATREAKDTLPTLPEGQAEEKATPAARPQPPPLPQATQWHVSIGGESAGPYPAARIKTLISEGRVTRDSLVWKEGMSGWVRADSVAEISKLFSAAPPPLPPN